MKSFQTARKVIEEFETANVFEIAEKLNIHVIYESWHPVTVGEFDKKSKTIRVNKRALMNDNYSARKIVAHELGHFFAAPFNYDRKSEEIFAVEFAEELIKFV